MHATIPLSALPGPREPWLIGSTFRRFGAPLTFFQELKETYGDVTRFRLFNEQFVLISDPGLIQEMLVTKQNLFRKGRALEQARLFLGNSLLVSEGEEHARQRRLIQPAFHRGRIAGYAQTMAELAEEWSSRQQAGSTIDLALEMNRLTLSIVSRTLFGSEVESHAEEIAESLTVVVENFNKMLLPFWRYFRHVPTPENLRLKRAQRHLDETIFRLISERRADKRDHGDLLSMLLAAEEAENPQKRLSDEEVRDQAMTLFIAGHETTANALSWTWHLLAQHKEVRQKVVAEIREVLGAEPTRRLGMEDMPKLIYTTAVLSEGMRIYPPVWVVGRRALEDLTLGNYQIPRRTIVLACQFILHRDGRLWPEPMEFRPERWLMEDPTRPKFAYFPFGGGGRICIGESFAWMEGVLALAEIARHWRFIPVPGHPIELIPSVTLRPKHGLKMVVEKADDFGTTA